MALSREAKCQSAVLLGVMFKAFETTAIRAVKRQEKASKKQVKALTPKIRSNSQINKSKMHQSRYTEVGTKAATKLPPSIILCLTDDYP